MGMKKFGIIALALTLCLAMTGAAFAMWSETLTIDGTVNTGEVDVEFSEQLSNDPPIVSDPTAGDPAECGIWTFVDIDDPTTWTWSGAVQPEGKEVASIDCEIDPRNNGDTKLMYITVDNGYPCYYGNIAFSIDNIGTIPVKILSIKLVTISKYAIPPLTGKEVTVNVDLVACDTYYVDVDAETVSTTPDVNGLDTDDFSLHLSELKYGQQIDPSATVGAGITAIPGDLCVHVEQGADELTKYDFSIEIVAAQWNEVP